MAPLSMKGKLKQTMQNIAFKAILAGRINIKGCDDHENTFARNGV